MRTGNSESSASGGIGLGERQVRISTVGWDGQRTSKVHTIPRTLERNSRGCASRRCQKVVYLFVIDFEVGCTQEKFTVWMLKLQIIYRALRHNL